MNPAAFETDPLLRLLTDALRRGPGSPEWHDAVDQLRDRGGAEADEYRLLVAARERLESGREYREVRAGPDFTRELFGALRDGPSAGNRFSPKVLIRLLAMLLVAGLVGVIVMTLASPGPASSQQLSGRLFITPVHDWNFAAMPDDLRPLGGLPLDARSGGLRPGGRDSDVTATGVLAGHDAIDLVRGTCVEMRLDYKPGPTSAALCLLTDPDSPDAAALSVMCDANGVQLVSPSATTPRPLSGGSHLLRLKVVGDDAVAEVDGQQIWAGPNPLGAQAFVGVRMTRTGKTGDVTVRALRVLAP